MKKVVVIGLLGSAMDIGKRPTRWKRWRPTVALCQQETFSVDRFDLIYSNKFASLLRVVTKDIQHESPETEVVPHQVEMSNPWDFEEVYGALHDFSEDYEFNVEEEDYYIHITTGSHVAQICMFLLTETHHFPAKLLQTSPPPKERKHEVKGQYQVIDLDLSKYDRIAQRFGKEFDNDISFLKFGIETNNKKFNTLIEEIELVAMKSKEPILLTGPTGAGKSQLAERIYELKKVKRQIEKDFVEVNCATLKGENAMAALFGHKKGAFTGADIAREGYLMTANKGMLFLDEVGELGLDEQAMLLRAIEVKRFYPMGSDTEKNSDFQLICGTNQDLQKAVKDGRFREDLLARINLWTFTMPGLRERPEDIEPNLAYELHRFEDKNGTHVTFNKEAMDVFLSFATSPNSLWSANFRDLSGAITRMATLSHGGRINQKIVEREIERLRCSWSKAKEYTSDDILFDVLGEEKSLSLDRFEKSQLADVLMVCRKTNTVAEAGRILFSVSRQKKKTANDSDRLRRYLLKYDLKYSDL